MKATLPLLASSIECEDDCLIIVLKDDNNSHRIPWDQCSQRLKHATRDQRINCELSPGGYGIHWPALDEDLSITGLINSIL